ncbi:MAG: hypothetical protein ABI690_10650 [Chloroflexota bacterium]
MKLSERTKDAINIGGCFFGAVIGVVGIVIAIYFGFRQSPAKAAEWRIDAGGWLVTVQDNLQSQGKIEILFDGQVAENVQFMTATFTNTGNVPLSADDFNVPMSLKLLDKTKIFSAAITRKQPENLVINYHIEGTSVVFEPTLINAGESFTVQIVGSSIPVKPSVGGRIVGLSSIPIYENTVSQIFLPTWATYGLFLIAGIAGGVLGGFIVLVFSVRGFLKSLAQIIIKNRLTAAKTQVESEQT